MSASETIDENRAAARAMPGRVRVWDVPIRVLHWALVASIGVCWWTGMHNQLEYHLYTGYAAIWIVLMRLYWGVAGSSTARFSNFVRGPKAVWDYARGLLRRDTPDVHGHNALGAISVLLLLGLVLAVAGLGLFAVDVDGLYSGPLSSYVSFHAGRHIAHLHYKWFNVLLAAISLHIVAVIFYLAYKHQNLISPMISGWRSGAPDQRDELRTVPFWRLVLGAVIASAIVWAITTGFYF